MAEEESGSSNDTNLCWNKIVRDHKKAGFREGVSYGREQNFQENFDNGYKDGLANGFLIGKYKGILKIRSLKEKKLCDEELVANSRKGWCVLCKDKSLLESPIEEIKNAQIETLNVFSNQLQTKYKLNVSM